MDLLAQTTDGFHTIDADSQVKARALHFLGQWLTAPDFAAYRPQLEWLSRIKAVL